MEEENKEKRFHSVDTRWELFGCPTFESYLEKYLVDGRFHGKVPKAVIDSYLTVEYLMAHAYYFYPMYDEALSKLLRTMEMATKLRCKDIGIDIVNHNRSTPNKTVYHSFAYLIDKIEQAEPEKRIGSALHWSRTIRNFSMHPDANSYMGGTCNPACISCVNIINTLFAPSGFFNGYVAEFESVKTQLEHLNLKPIVLSYNSERILVHKVEVIDIFLDGARKIYCVYAPSILPSLEKQGDEDYRFGTIFVFYLTDLSFETNKFTGIQLGSEEVISFEASEHSLNLSRYTAYKSYIRNAMLGTLNHYEMLEASQQASVIAYFRYNFYSGYTFDS